MRGRGRGVLEGRGSKRRRGGEKERKEMEEKVLNKKVGEIGIDQISN